MTEAAFKEGRVYALEVLGRIGDQEMPDGALEAALRVRLGLRDFEARRIIEANEWAGLMAGTESDLVGKKWRLTPQGILQLAR